jgi:CheY-like chemotaxis protein
MAEILVIDDEAPIRETLKEILEYENYNVTTADDGNTFSCLQCRNLWRHPSFIPCVIDDGDFNLLDRDGILVDSQDTCRFTWRRAETPGELWEVIGGV